MSLFDELKRRNVIRVAIAYGVVAWLVLQLAEVLVSLLPIPEQVGRYVVIALLIGFPLTLILSWLYELTPQGVRRDDEVEHSEQPQGIGSRRIDFIIIGLMAVALTYFAWDKFYWQPRLESQVMAGSDSIAVLPLVNKGTNEDSALLALGIHDDLLTELSKLGNLRVISRTSVMEYADTSKNLREVGRELGVAQILEGGVQQVGNRVRINMQLIATEDDRHLWAETYDREFTPEQIFEVQADIAREVASSLHVALGEPSPVSIGVTRTSNLAAYRDYLAGMRAMNDPQREGGRIAATEFFSSAVEKDPEFAQAWVRLAHALQQEYWFNRNNAGALDQAIAALENAEELAPEMPELHLVRAVVLYHGFLDYEGALLELDKAEQGMPGHNEIFEWRGYIYRRQMRIPEAAEALAKAWELSPRDPYFLWENVSMLLMQRRYGDARALVNSEKATIAVPAWLDWMRAQIAWAETGDAQAVLQQALRPDAPPNHRDIALWAWRAGELEVALEHAALMEDDVISGQEYFAVPEELQGALLQASGDAEGAQSKFETALSRTQQELAEAPRDGTRLQALARIYAYLGRDEKAIRTAQHALTEFDRIDDPFAQHTFRNLHALLMCQLGKLDETESIFRDILSGPDEQSLVTMIRSYPPCREKFEGTEHYQRLYDEFRHLSEKPDAP